MRDWDILTEIVTASNQQDYPALYRTLGNPLYDIKNKPQCIHAALSSILLTKEHIETYREQLLAFALSVDSSEMQDLRTSMRFSILKDQLGIKPVTEDKSHA